MNKEETELQIPVAQERGRGTLWLVWLIPLVAFIIAGWMVYKYYAEQGIDIVVSFDSGNGVEIGKTPLLYKGIKIGTVSDVSIDPRDLRKVVVTVTVDRRAIRGVARKGNTFVMVHPKVTLTEVTGLETILSGIYIEAVPAVNDSDELYKLPEQYAFTGTDKMPTSYADDGVYVTLLSKDGSLGTGAPVLYHKFVVGQVVKQELSEQGVHYLVHIEPEYAWLVKKQSHFWKLSGIELKASLAGIKLSLDSVATMLVGGIAFDSPQDGERIDSNVIERVLYADHDEMELSGDKIVLTAEEAYNLTADLSKVYYHGIAVGKVTSLVYLPDSDKTRITLQLNRRFRHLANKEAYFWVVRPQLSFKGVKGLDAIARGAYIAFSTNEKSAMRANSFTLHEKAKAPAGKRIDLHADVTEGIKEGTPIFYRDIEVGIVTGVAITSDTHKPGIEAVVRKDYERFLNDSSLFYIRSGIEAEASLEHIYVKSGSLEELIAGGIAFKTPDLKAGHSKTEFRLFKSKKALEDYRYRNGNGRRVRLALPTLGSLSAGDPVLYKQNRAGEILSVDYDAQKDRFVLEMFVSTPYSKKINASTRFARASGIELKLAFPNVSMKAESLETILRGGLTCETPEPSAPAVEDMHLFNLYDTASESVPFTIYCEKADGIKSGSAVIYKGVSVGAVSEVALEAKRVKISATIDKRYATLLDSESWFWLEPFTMGLGGVRNASAILSGPSISLMPGHSGTLSDKFTLRKAPPPPTYGLEGLRVTLVGDRKSSLKAGSPLLYRQVKIGQVESWRLANDGTAVEIVAYVEPKYRHLVRQNAKFYNATAFGMNVNLLGVKVKTETVETMLSGGIGMAVPEPAEAEAKEGARFKLYNAPEEAWMTWKPKL